MSPAKTYSDYLQLLKETLDRIAVADLEEITQVLSRAFHEDKCVFVLGNGGSAATASHLACDFAKTVLGKEGHTVDRRLRCIALTDSMPMLTAYGNDLGYDDVFSEALRTLSRPGDVVIAISASGNSPNVLKALETARKCSLTSISFLGFGGGRAVGLSDHAFLVDGRHYGVVEDVHSVVMHMLTEQLKLVVAAGQ